MPITLPRISNLVKVINTTDIEIMQKLIDAPINTNSGNPIAFESVWANKISSTYQTTIVIIMNRSGRRELTTDAINSDPTNAPTANTATI